MQSASHAERLLTVCIVEEAETFGGSIVSTGNLIRGLDPARFRVVLTTAAPLALVKSQLGDAVEQTQIQFLAKALGYRRIGRWKVQLSKGTSGAWMRVPVYLLYAIRWIGNLPYVWKLWRLLRRHDVLIVQTNNGFNEEAALAARLAGAVIVTYFRGYAPMSRIVRWWVAPRTHAYFCVSEYVRNEAIRDGLPAAHVHVHTPPVIPEALDADSVQKLRDQHGIAPDAPVIGSVGRIIPWKGQRETVLAAAPALRAYPEARLLIVGGTSDGPLDYRESVRHLVEELGLTNQVIFTGYVPKVHEYYALMDLVVHSAIEPEPSGRVIVEALSYGCPVIASPLGGAGEFVIDGVDGYLCDPHDTALVSSRILSLLDSPEQRRVMGSAGRDRILTELNAQRYAEAMGARYHEVLRGTGPENLRRE